jgi:hypothetical protein
MAVGRENLELAQLAEAHWDAVAILAEANRQPDADAIYGAWASEIPGEQLALRPSGASFVLRGTKRFCSGTSNSLGVICKSRNSRAPTPWSKKWTVKGRGEGIHRQRLAFGL